MLVRVLSLHEQDEERIPDSFLRNSWFRPHFDAVSQGILNLPWDSFTSRTNPSIHVPDLLQPQKPTLLRIPTPVPTLPRPHSSRPRRPSFAPSEFTATYEFLHILCNNLQACGGILKRTTYPVP
ncbi:Protein of unknown function [Pyronema omphalodes CBS 100304]|uniref:Uncharacterized protein n=1 Tax=Pyronema omphalodes (strain CBS 100304) TaxID=1076935 RepID=U4KU99_PYROM|nr:Protein of unknown function [Pyronema omphalodes CBS 100304]